MSQQQPKSNQWQLGREGEDQVLKHYLSEGYELITRNFQFYKQGTQGRQGEIDLILKKDSKLHLVEVKTRSNYQYGSIVGQINITKLKILYRTYQYFIKQNPIFRDYFCQMDVGEVMNNQVKIWPNCYSFDFIGRR